jgi:pyruvate kinase
MTNRLQTLLSNFDLRRYTEATDIANIVLDGADGLLLGLETLEGQFPLTCLETVLAIAREADAVYDYESRYRRQMQVVNVKLAKATDSVPWGPGATVAQGGAAAGAAGAAWGGAAAGGGGSSGARDSGGGGGGGAGSISPRGSQHGAVRQMRSSSINMTAIKPLEGVALLNLKKEALAAAAVQTSYQTNAKLIVAGGVLRTSTRPTLKLPLLLRALRASVPAFTLKVVTRACPISVRVLVLNDPPT